MAIDHDFNARVDVGEVEHVASADGTSIAFRRVGRGPRLIAIHGGLGTWRSWLAVARHLSDRYESVLVERRGRGDSPDSNAPYALAHEVEDITAVHNRVGPVKAVVGHSFGGLVALELARQVDVDTLLVYEPPAGGGGLIPAAALAGIEDHLTQGNATGALTLGISELHTAGLVRAEARPANASWPRGLLELAPTIARELRAVSELETSLDRYATITAPVLVLVGTASPTRQQQLCAQLADALPDARLTPLPNQGHVAHTQAPDAVATAIARFLGPYQ